ncbi:MAG: response regulator [Leptospira sp.]|nr:response regulator [Leptospira sp.]
MNKTILAVDDSVTMREMVKQILDLGGYDSVFANDGMEGLEKFNTITADLVITDINMPRMDGITFIREIRKINTDVPILTLTTESESGIMKEGQMAGANGWVVKPFRPAQFLDIVKQIIP